MMIDLAGNEGNAETATHDREQRAEAAEINASLMAVSSCMRARATGATHVPFRDSTLTRVLRDAFTDESSRLAMLACVSPACSHLERTICTLRNAVTLLSDVKLPEAVAEDVESAAEPPATQAGGSGAGSAAGLKGAAGGKGVAAGGKGAAAGGKGAAGGRGAGAKAKGPPGAKGRKALAMRSMALSQLFADLKTSWGGDDRSVWPAEGWAMLQLEIKRPALALIDDARLLLLCDQVKQHLQSDEFNFAAFEAFCVLLAEPENASMPVSALVKTVRACSGLPLCPACVQGLAASVDVPAPAPVDTGAFQERDKCPGCFKSYA